MIETKSQKYTEKAIVQQHIHDHESTHSSAASNPIWRFLLKLHERHVTKSGELKRDAVASFKKYIDKNYPAATAKNKPIHDAYSHLTKILAQPVNRFDVIPEDLINKMDTELRPKTTCKFNTKTETVMPLLMVFSLVYLAILDQSCFPESSSKKNRLLTLCNALAILHQTKSEICHTGVRNDLVHTLNLIYTLPDSETPVIFLDDIDSALLSWIKQKTRYFLKVLSENNNTKYHALMLQWLKAEETPDEVIELLNAKHPEKSGITIMRDYLEQQLKSFDFNSAKDKQKLNNFLSSEALKFLETPLESGEFYYVLRDVFKQPSTIGYELRDQIFNQLKLEIESKLVQGEITAETESQHIQQLQNFLQVDKAFVLYQKYRYIFKTQTELGIESLKKTSRSFYRKFHFESQSSPESKRESKVQKSELRLKKFSDFIIKANRFLKDSHISFIENFFTIFHESSNLEKTKLYAQWFSLFELDKITVSDTWLQEIRQRNEQVDGLRIVRIGPYEINRIVMHALLLSPKIWTDLFAETYSLVLEQLNREEFEVFLTQEFRDNAYPADFRVQLNFIKTLRDRHILIAEEKSVQAKKNLQYPVGKLTVFPLSYWLPDLNELKFIRDLSCQLTSAQRAHLFEMIDAEQIQRFMENGPKLFSLLPHIYQDLHGILLTKLGAVLQKIIQDSDQLVVILSHLNSEQHGNLLNAIGDVNLRSMITDGQKLAWILIRLNLMQHENLLKLLGQKHLQSIIMNGAQLYSILVHLRRSQYGIVLTCLDKQLKKIIHGFDQFNSILFLLASEQRQHFLTALGANLRAFISDSYHFSLILKSLNGEETGIFLIAIGTEHLQAIICNASELCSALSCLNTEQREIILTAIGVEYFKTILKNANQLIRILEGLNIQHREKLLLEIGVDQLRIIIRNHLQLVRLITLLDTEAGAKFLNAISSEKVTALIQNDNQLTSVLLSLNSEQRGNLLTVIGGKRICEFFLPAYKQNVINILSYQYVFRFVGWRRHAPRMDALKQEINKLNSVKEIYDVLNQELEAYSSQAIAANKHPVRSLIPSFSFFKQDDLWQDKEKSRYYQAVEMAKTYFSVLGDHSALLAYGARVARPHAGEPPALQFRCS